MAHIRPLKEREGDLLLALIPAIHPTEIQHVRLYLVEEAGIWVESQAMTNMWMQAAKSTSAPRTSVYFLPWHQITFIMDAIDIPAFADAAAQL